jgi:HAD superfamily hydrolase (TIGR01509 family)
VVAFIFDIDGTLIDDNAAHVEAWRRAFAIEGRRLDPARIRAEIGKGGDLLVAALVGDDADLRVGDAIRDAHDRAFFDIAALEHFRPTAGAAELLQELRRRGIRTAAATSSSMHQLAATLRSAAFPLEELVDVVVAREAGQESKPAPDVVRASAERLAVPPSECLLVGDTRWDGQAASRAGVTFLGMLCGGTSSSGELVAAGARAVFADPGELLEVLGSVLEVHGPRTTPGPT